MVKRPSPDRLDPEWFVLGEQATALTMERVRDAIKASALPIEVKYAPAMAHWFVLDSLLLANQANREGMHANALALTRQCIEALSIIELGISGSDAAIELLTKWSSDSVSPGQLRKWLSENVWPNYGSGLWHEPWSEFMANLASAVQPYAHYTSKLAQWQMRLIGQSRPGSDELFVEVRPRAYDPQKATRITLYHAIFTYALGRITIAKAPSGDPKYRAFLIRLGKALGKSKYLDGHQTNWPEQFWAMVWSGQTGSTILE